MSELEPSVEANKARIQQLYARGLIGISEYQELGRMHGFVSPLPSVPPTATARALQVARWSGYAMLVLGAVAQVVSTRRPDLKGPLDALLEIAQLISGSLGTGF